LASNALAASDAKRALTRIQQALTLEPQEPIFYQLASVIYGALNDLQSSHTMNNKIEKLIAQGH